ncbi:MAG: tRNA (guanosine(37)-N1)-methyltransferase TrmD [Alphaproteobacteria bacterium]|nr:tRNA (guanosine(37)-N1)-methyltransferase TrmD [Alphaproteobacteria bacterium]
MTNNPEQPTPWRISVITLMPEMYPGPLGHSLVGEALTRRIWELTLVNLRDFGIGPHRKVDDSPAGGGAGMVLKPDVVDAAITHAQQSNPAAQLIHFSPRGERMNQPLLRELSQTPLILLCGRYEAVDERVLEKHAPREVSLGDFVLTGGDIPAMALIDGCVRLLPGVVGKEASLGEESFGDGVYANLLEYPHYTKPAVWEGREIPEVLLSGHHAHIAQWRLAQAQAITARKRPDLLKK